jgi:hypothetical protein
MKNRHTYKSIDGEADQGGRGKNSAFHAANGGTKNDTLMSDSPLEQAAQTTHNRVRQNKADGGIYKKRQGAVS